MVNAQELHKDLIQPKKIQKKLASKGLHQATHYACTLAAILRERRLNEN